LKIQQRTPKHQGTDQCRKAEREDASDEVIIHRTFLQESFQPCGSVFGAPLVMHHPAVYFMYFLQASELYFAGAFDPVRFGGLGFFVLETADDDVWQLDEFAFDV
jgi:hypothetical protein